jgi:hypothetical protein
MPYQISTVAVKSTGTQWYWDANPDWYAQTVNWVSTFTGYITATNTVIDANTMEFTTVFDTQANLYAMCDARDDPSNQMFMPMKLYVESQGQSFASDQEGEV